MIHHILFSFLSLFFSSFTSGLSKGLLPRSCLVHPGVYLKAPRMAPLTMKKITKARGTLFHKSELLSLEPCVHDIWHEYTQQLLVNIYNYIKTRWSALLLTTSARAVSRQMAFSAKLFPVYPSTPAIKGLSRTSSGNQAAVGTFAL